MIAKRKSSVANKHFKSALFAIACVLLLGGSSSVFACMCGKVSTCEQFNFYEPIFVGKAVSIEKEQKGSLETETTVFEVEEMLVGERVASIRVRNKSGFSCGTEFTVGETYLVFAGGSKEKGYGTGFCSGNLPLEYAGEQIAELRKLSGSRGDGRLTGTVLEQAAKRSRGEERAPIKDVRMEITELSTGRKYSTSTNASGRYEVAVPPGRYTVAPVAPASSPLSNLFGTETMEVRSGGCAEGFFVLANNSIVAGRLLDAAGKPVPYVRVELLSVDEKSSYRGGESGESDQNGYFSIKQVPAGKYTLSINYNSNPDPESPFPTTFYSAGSDRSLAKIIEIGFGSRVEGITWALPPRLGEKAFSGIVVGEDGSPAIGAEVKLFDQAFPGFYAGCFILENRDNAADANSPVRSTSIRMTGPACDLKSDSNGAFRLSGYTDRIYRISASITRTTDGQKVEYTGESEPFSLNGEPPSIRLVLRKK